MEKNQLWITIGVTFIVAIVVSLATASITGNLISSSSSTTSNVVTYQGVLDMFDKNCGLYLARNNKTCSQECKFAGNRTCVKALTVSWQNSTYKGKTPEVLYEQLDSCNRLAMGGALMKRIDCICCYPPK